MLIVACVSFSGQKGIAPHGGSPEVNTAGKMQHREDHESAELLLSDLRSCGYLAPVSVLNFFTCSCSLPAHNVVLVKRLLAPQETNGCVCWLALRVSGVLNKEHVFVVGKCVYAKLHLSSKDNIRFIWTHLDFFAGSRIAEPRDLLVISAAPKFGEWRSCGYH